MSDSYTQLASAAHSGAFGLGAKRTPTADQVRAGNYAKGSLRLHGLPITIETPMFTPRTGKEDGKPWSIVCMANYGYINGTKGADGDAFDVYVGPVPESMLVVVVNQVKKDGSFDEHKAVLGFYDADTALTAYRNSYQKDWRGMGSFVVCTMRQFKAWLKSGDLSKPLAAGELVPDELKATTAAFVTWGENDLPVGVTVGDVIYDLRRLDHDKLMLDSASMADITELLSDGSMLDAMVIEFAKFDRKAGQLLRVMQAVTGEVKAESVEVSKPFKNRGTTQVAMLFSMSDGQSVSVFFHNPDSTPNKLAPTDELISWKWVLNKKDITVVVAPERGQDISPRQVARRIMALVQKNSAKFTQAAGASAEKTAQLEGLKVQAQEKLAEVERLDAEIAELQAKVDALPKQPAPPAEDGSSPPLAATDTSYTHRALAKADAAAERLKAQGVTPMTREEFMAQVNGGESSGFSMDTLAERLKEYQDTLAGVRDGTVKPRSVVGKGGTKKAAIAWLEKGIAEVQGALDTGGINYPVNANNYEYHLSKQLRELEAQQAGGTENQDHGNGADDAEAQKIARLLEMLAAARTKLADMSPGDAFYGNLATDIAGMAKQLWEAGYRGPEAIQAAPEPVNRTAWEETVTQTLADIMRVSYGDAAGVMEAHEAVVDGQFAAGATPEAAAQFIEKAVQQPDMLGDDPALRDNRTDLEKLTDSLKAGDSLRALSLLQRFEDPAVLRKLVTDAGFSLGVSATVDEILSGVGRDLVRAGRNKVDGFGLAAMDKAAFEAAQAAAEPPPAPSATEGDETGDIAPEGRENTVKTAKGTKVVTGFRVIEAKNLIISHEADGTPNPDYPSELQPRDRARATSQAWVQKTARSLDPDSLGRTNRADSGAPIVGPDRVVESGNGRAMSIREAYRIGHADEYREWLLEHADYFKVNAAKIEAMKAPVLVRVRVSEVNRAEFAVEANQDDKLAMTATEKARSDAKRLDSAMMAKLVDGDLSSGANRSFVNAFLQSLGDAEAAQYLTSDGNPTASLISRVQAALFAGAYSDDRLLELTADVSKPEIANIVSALNMAAPDFMRAKDLDQVGAETAGEKVADSLELSLDQEAVNAILDATNMLRKAKESGMGLEEFLRQGDMFGGVDPAVAAMAMFISKNNRSAKRLGTAFKAMAQFVETEAKRKQTAGLFGDEPARFVDIVKAANEQLEKEFGEGVFAIEQNDLFSQAPPAHPAAPAVVENNSEDDALKEAKAYLDSVIEGNADMSAPEKVMKRLEEIYAAYGEGELSGLFSEAAEAFAQHALKATAGDF